uniref:Uncharacterized protein n=1 Tax=Hyaloperonospora arabidopsidis (strain Emoy2) TaxID=559515 RepID=M4BAY4_HYAAE
MAVDLLCQVSAYIKTQIASATECTLIRAQSLLHKYQDIRAAWRRLPQEFENKWFLIECEAHPSNNVGVRTKIQREKLSKLHVATGTSCG